MEGDKYNFVDHLPKIITPVITQEVDVTIANRSKAGWNSYPLVQKTVEGAFNWFAGIRTGIRGDYIFGPKSFTKEVATYIPDYNVDDFGATLIYPISRAVSEGKRVIMVEVPGNAPEDYMKKYGGGFTPIKHLAWRLLQNKGNLKGLSDGLKKGKR